MTDLLDNALVRKYFGCDAHEMVCPNGNEYDEHMALRVILAMHDPIKEGDLVLELNGCGAPIGALERKSPHDIKPFHGLWLRIPQRFQPKPAVKECPNLTVTCSCGMKISHPDVATRRHEGEPPAAPEKCICDIGSIEASCPKHKYIEHPCCTTAPFCCHIGEPRPPPPTERCLCVCHSQSQNCFCTDCMYKHSTDQAVESKIKEILNAEHDWLKDRLDYRLRELVLLARGGKG